MARAYFKKHFKEIAKAYVQMPAPSQHDLDKIKVATFTCRTIEDFAEFLEMNPLAFKAWVDNYDSVRKIYKSWRDHMTDKVEAAMAKRALGFTKKVRKDVITRQGTVETLVTEQYFPPDTSAAQFWLKNRRPDEWKETTQLDVNLQADIRAWLISATGDQPQDKTEVLNITPQVVEAKPVEALPKPILKEVIELIVPEIVPETKIETIPKVEIEVMPEIKLEVELEAIPDAEPAAPQPSGFAQLNSRWG